jgi:RecA/RadA recombinase
MNALARTRPNRERLEAMLDARKLGGALRPVWALGGTNARVTSTGLPQLDQELGGGWRQGEISEIVGARSAGKTSLLLASLQAAIGDGGVAALVDAVDRLDPASLQYAGVDLRRVLWVRGPAISIEMARPSVIEDVVSRAVRAFDLIIRSGGFALVALDLADVPARYLRGLPWATWKRLAYANEGRSTVGLIVVPEPVGRSARGVSLTMTSSPLWIGTSDQSRRFGGFENRARCSAAS